MAFNLRIQDPASADATLLELLAEGATGANLGVGMFSFASTNGVKLLIDDPDFKYFLRRSRFEIIVGVDAVTVPATLNLLGETERMHHGFQARVFFHQRRGSLFHPKFCWFASARHVRVLIGSGNLTQGGLLKNWEAFADTTLHSTEQDRLLADWDSWRQVNNNLLRTVGDPDVLARARRNEGHFRRRHEEDEVEDADKSVDEGPTGASVLLAQIPKASDRWNQANFDLDTFTNFFNAQPGTYHRIVLLPIAGDGSVGEPEARPSVSVKSRNFRIELGQAAGLAYPAANRPIGLFLQLATRRFRYRLLMPNDHHYTTVAAFVDDRWTGHGGRMKRIVVPLEDFRRALPDVIL